MLYEQLVIYDQPVQLVFLVILSLEHAVMLEYLNM